MATDRFLPPWREVLPNGNLGPEYGPSPATFARQVQEHKDWATKRQPTHRDYAPLLREFIESKPGAVSEQQLQCYMLVHVQGLGTKLAAIDMGVTRSSVRTYLARLEEKALAWKRG